MNKPRAKNKTTYKLKIKQKSLSVAKEQLVCHSKIWCFTSNTPTQVYNLVLQS